MRQPACPVQCGCRSRRRCDRSVVTASQPGPAANLLRHEASLCHRSDCERRAAPRLQRDWSLTMPTTRSAYAASWDPYVRATTRSTEVRVRPRRPTDPASVIRNRCAPIPDSLGLRRNDRDRQSREIKDSRRCLALSFIPKGQRFVVALTVSRREELALAHPEVQLHVCPLPRGHSHRLRLDCSSGSPGPDAATHKWAAPALLA